MITTLLAVGMPFIDWNWPEYKNFYSCTPATTFLYRCSATVYIHVIYFTSLHRPVN